MQICLASQRDATEGVLVHREPVRFEDMSASSSAFTDGCISGASVDWVCQIAATAKPSAPHARKESLQPQFVIIQAIKGGVKAPPIPTATRNRLLPRALSLTGIHRPIILLVFDKAGLSPTPIKKRTIQNEPATPNHSRSGKLGAAAVSAVKTDHKTIASVKIRRAPK